jgi:hypothetical protein
MHNASGSAFLDEALPPRNIYETMGQAANDLHPGLQSLYVHVSLHVSTGDKVLVQAVMLYMPCLGD